MDSTFFNNSNSNKHFMSDQEENDNNTTSSTPENSSDSPPPCTTAFNDVYSSNSKTNNNNNITSTSSPKKSGRRAIQKRVVSIPIKGDSNTNTPPPSDSWAWRKYGQKPIKGSPYPRGYYRCSSSKGCPARKQVERSRMDPTMLVITYSADHNHPWPASRNHHHNNSKPGTSSTKHETPAEEPHPQLESFADLGADDSSLIANDDFGWFADMETTSSTVLESPIFAEDSADVAPAMVFPMREEDESLFADLGELPECSLVFRHRGVGVGPQVQIC